MIKLIKLHRLMLLTNKLRLITVLIEVMIIFICILLTRNARLNYLTDNLNNYSFQFWLYLRCISYPFFIFIFANSISYKNDNYLYLVLTTYKKELYIISKLMTLFFYMIDFFIKTFVIYNVIGLIFIPHYYFDMRWLAFFVHILIACNYFSLCSFLLMLFLNNIFGSFLIMLLALFSIVMSSISNSKFCFIIPVMANDLTTRGESLYFIVLSLLLILVITFFYKNKNHLEK